MCCWWMPAGRRIDETAEEKQSTDLKGYCPGSESLPLDDIAGFAGPPETTRVSSATRKRVVEIAKRFNYRPNLLARSVVGFDDIEMAGLPGVELTTISHPKHTLGRLAVEQLLAKIKGQSDNVVKKTLSIPS